MSNISIIDSRISYIILMSTTSINIAVTTPLNNLDFPLLAVVADKNARAKNEQRFSEFVVGFIQPKADGKANIVMTEYTRLNQ